MSRWGVPKISVRANSIIAKMLLALHSKPPSETRLSQPTDCFTPPSAFSSSGCALPGNTWRMRLWKCASVCGSRIAKPISDSAPSMIGNIDMKPAKASASAKLLAWLSPYAVRTRAGRVFWARSTSCWRRARRPAMLLRLGRRVDVVGRGDDALEQRAAGGADERRRNLAEDALHRSRLVIGLLVDPHGHRGQAILQPRRRVGCQAPEVFEGELVEAVPQGGPVRASIEEESGAAQGDDTKHHSRDAAVSDSSRSRLALQLR